MRLSKELRYLAISAILLVPCFWQSRIQAGDLASHVYNAWLAQLIEAGQAPGLSIAPVRTNVLFDLVLSGLWSLGPALAQRIAVVAAVLIFAWGVFALASVAARQKPWFLLPAIAMLAYGWVFHIGFFNFYLSLGLCLWALALLWRPNPVRIVAALALAALAYVAHALPLGWAVGAIAYTVVARVLRPPYRVPLCLSSVGLLFVLSWVLQQRYPTHWFPLQISMMTGSDQLWVFGGGYRILQPALLAIWGLMLAGLIRRRGWRRLAYSVPFQITLLTAALVAIIPASIMLSGYRHPLNYIADRMSLAVAIGACVVLARARPRPFETGVLAALAVVFFGMLYMDERDMNRLEDGIAEAVAQLPPSQRVVSVILNPNTRADPLVHLVDRACIGWCYSYANYEASTTQFRIRAAGNNPIVTASAADAFAMQFGGYQVQPRDLPMYVVFPAPGPAGRFATRPLEAGETIRAVQRVE